MLCRKRDLNIADTSFALMQSKIPPLLTPGAAEALAVKIYREVRTASAPLETVLNSCLSDYQNPIAPDVMAFQIQLAVKEATDLDFVPSIFRAGRTPT
jgi:hypothetical protein